MKCNALLTVIISGDFSSHFMIVLKICRKPLIIKPELR